MAIFKLIKMQLLFLILLVITPFVLSFPLLPCQFHGEIMVNGSYAKPGTNVSVLDKDGILCGSAITEEYGRYIVGCTGDDLSTGADEGAGEGEKVHLYIDGKEAREMTWKEGGFVKSDFRSSFSEPEEEVEMSSPEDAGFYLLLVLLFSAMVFIIFVRIRKDGN